MSHTTQPPKFLGNLTGVSFRPAAAKAVAYELLKPGAELTLKRDPTNPHDENAVEVHYALTRNPTLGEWYGDERVLVSEDDEEETRRLLTSVDEDVFIGFIERSVAASLARWMDEGFEYKAKTKTRIDHKMTPWLLEIEPTGERMLRENEDENLGEDPENLFESDDEDHGDVGFTAFTDDD